MPKITQEELEQLDREELNGKLVAGMSIIAERLKPLAEQDKETQSLLKENLVALRDIAKKDNSPDMKPLVAEISNALKEMGKPVEHKMPKSFKFLRDKEGKISEAVVIYE